MQTNIKTNFLLNSPFTYSNSKTNQFFLRKNELDRLKRSEYHTHLPNQDQAERCFQIAKTCFKPWKATLSLMSHIVQPHPGKGKGNSFNGAVIRLSSLIGFFAGIIPSLAIAAIGLPFYAYSHTYRPIIGYINTCDINNNSANQPSQNKTHGTHQLTMRTHNVALVHNFMRISNDLRDVEKRANELADAILKDHNAPNVMCLQETFNEDAIKILCDRLKNKYPYIIHSVAPHISGFNSGLMVLSQYPIEDISYHRFENCLGEEKLATKGLLGARIKVGDKYVQIYNVHTQGLPGHKRAEVRLKQLKQVLEWIEDDLKKNNDNNQPAPSRTMLLGDFNISQLSAWGEFNDEEQASFDLLKERFDNIFDKDHDPVTHIRTSGDRMFNDGKPESTGTWENGPFPEKPSIFKFEDWSYRKWNGLPPKKIDKRVNHIPSKWGYEKQWNPSTTSACFDYILSLKRKEGSELRPNDRAEIHRIDLATGQPSGLSDHLPVDAVIDLENS